MSSARAHPTNAAWYCLRTQPRHEHIAAANLRADAGVEVFLPRIRFRRKTRVGPQWVNEALFPAYLFARFEFTAQLRRVQSARGVRGVVHFGDRWPVIPDAVIAELRAAVGDGQLRVLPDDYEAGEEIHVAAGPFAGLAAIVTRHQPARQRVAVLLDFLGRQTAVELPEASVLKTSERRTRLLG